MRLFTMLAILVSLSAVRADDWPQFRGPKRDGVSKEANILQAWPKDGPKLLWTYKDAGIGFSGPAVVGDRIYLCGTRDDDEMLISLNAKDAKEIWAAKIGPNFTFNGNSWGDGPRSSPTIDGERVYALGGQGILVCVDSKKGDVIWKADLIKDFKGKVMEVWGYCESPLVDGNQVIVCPGGKDGTMIALDKKTGKEIWRTKDLEDQASYSSAVVAEIGGVRQYIFTTFTKSGQGGHIVGVAAKDGKVLWKYKNTRFNTGVIPNPIVQGNHVYVANGYNVGCNLLEITAKGGEFEAKELLDKPLQRLMKNHHGGVVLVDGHLYGYCDQNGWLCQDFKTGKAVWKEKKADKLGKGSITAVGDRLYLFSEDDGICVLLKASPKGWEEEGRFEIPEKADSRAKRGTSSAAKVWTHPVIANGKLYLRDQELLFCYDVSKGK